MTTGKVLGRVVAGYALPAIFVSLLTAGCDARPAKGSTAVAERATARVPGIAGFSPSNAWSEVAAFVDLGPKPAFSLENSRAAAHIEARLKAHGLAPAIDVFTDVTPQGPRIFRNVTVELPGATGLVVLVSHFDTKSGIGTNFVGANDSGSSSGLLIELARCLGAEKKLPFGVLVAFVDGEECLREYTSQDGLHGSRRLAQRLKARRSEVLGAIVIDMIGDKDLSVTIPRNCSAKLMNLAFRAAHLVGAREKFSLASGSMLDDHVPLIQTGIGAVDLIDFHYGSTPGANDYWHTTADTLDKLSPGSLETVGKVVLHMLSTMDTKD